MAGRMMVANQLREKVRFVSLRAFPLQLERSGKR